MTHKLQWTKEKQSRGEQWAGKVLFNGVEMRIAVIRPAKKDGYILPENWFPKKGKEKIYPITVKTLPEAKKKCETIFSDFIKQMSK